MIRPVLIPVILFSATLLAPQALDAQRKPGKAAGDQQIEATDKLYAELVEILKANKIDPRRDDLRTIHAKREAVSKALAEFAKDTKHLMFSRLHLGLDYVRFAENTFPRLSGHVVKVGSNEEFMDLESAAAEIQPGDVVLLGEGAFVLPKVDREWRDIAFVGLGREKTTLTCQLQQAWRVRLAALKIDCENTECIYLRRGGAVQIQNCLITNYNSGAGGSNAVFAVGASLLIEDSRFEGRTGRAAGGSTGGGGAFDLRGSNFLYVRKTDFVDNDEIVRATSLCVFDRCRSMSRGGTGSGILLYPTGFLMVRRNLCKIRGEPSAEFELATDDREVVRHVVDPKAPLDDVAKAAVTTLGLWENPRYWATLLHHTDEELQFLASGRLAALLRGAMPKLRVDRKVVDQLPREMRKPFAAALRSSQALRWLEENEPKLKWSEKLRAYLLEK